MSDIITARRGFTRRAFLAHGAGLVAGLAVSKGPAMATEPSPPSLPPVSPPAPLTGIGGAWNLAFSDDFCDARGVDDRWIRMEIGGDQHPTQRLPENVTAGACDLGLALGHQDDAKRPFTGGYVKTRRFRQTYGYFECAMRIAAEPGVNNAFWLVSDPASERDGVQYELDVAEAKYPDRVNCAVHRWKPGPKWADGHWFRARTPLSKRFHRYALLWTAETFVFFFDDREVWRCPNTLAHSPAEIRFSNAVAPFAGRHDGDVRGAATTIGWVRVFAPA